MDIVSDLHLHSKYSRAVSRDMNLPTMSNFARKKGLELLSTADWTHPLWFREIQAQLEETTEGLFSLKSQKTNSHDHKQMFFLLSVEISSIYSKNGRVHRIHNLIFSPSFKSAEKINKELIRRGCNLNADGRPIIGISSHDLLSLVLDIDDRCMLIPCHIWTPWFSLYGANSGFDTLEECFGDMSKYVYAIETGLSSDPEMNWKIKDLDNRSILSFSDAHSPAKMGREATVFRIQELSYESIRLAIMNQSERYKKIENKDEYGDKIALNKVLYTIEFYPEEGKYHYNGHRNCKIIQTPEETKEKGDLCPVCNRKLTIGVMHRVQDLSNRNVCVNLQKNQQGLQWFKDPTSTHPPYIKMVPLNEIIAESFGVQVNSLKVKNTFDEMCETFGSEINILLKTPVVDIEKENGEKIAEGIEKVRSGNITIRPGFDGEYGIVKIWNEDEKINDSSALKITNESSDQLGIDF